MSWLNTEETNCNTTKANMQQYIKRYHSTKIYTKNYNDSFGRFLRPSIW